MTRHTVGDVTYMTVVEDTAGSCYGCVAEVDRALCKSLIGTVGCSDVIWKAAPKQPAGEADPTGRDQHAPGAKVDAGKAEYDMVLFSFPDALAKVDAVGKFGAAKYTKGGFLEVPDGQRRYLNAEVRHIIKRLRGEEIDPDSQEMHLAHQAWNALAQLQLYIEGKGA